MDKPTAKPMQGETKRQRDNLLVTQLKQERTPYESTWRELADHIMPFRGKWFIGEETQRKSRRSNKIINSTPRFAARIQASGMMAGLTSPARPWFRITTSDPALSDIPAVKGWLYSVERTMRDMFAKSNLYNALPTMYGELGTFATGCMLALEDDEDVMRFYPLTVGTYWIAQSARMEVDTLYRELTMTVRQVVEQFGMENCSASTQDSYRTGRHEAKVQVAHLIAPNEMRDTRRLDNRNMRWRSCYWEISSRDCDKYLRESGFRENPIMAPRWEVNGDDVYGTACPGLDAIGDAKALQFQEKRKAQAIDKFVDPPLMAPTSLRNAKVSLLPGDVTYVDVQQGQQGVRPIYEVSPQIQPLLMNIEEMESRINTAFYADLFLMFLNDDRGTPPTAEEIRARQAEKLLMLGPVLERLNDELLDLLIDRAFNVMMRRGLLPVPPEELQDVELKVEYISMLAQAQKQVGISAVDRLVGTVANLAQLDPRALKKLDVMETIDEYAQMLGTPPRLIKSDEDVMAMVAAEAQQAQAMQMAAMANQAADTAQKLGNTPVGDDETALGRIVDMAGAGLGA